MTHSNEQATLSKSTKSHNPDSSVQIQIRANYQAEFVLQDTKKSEFFDPVDSGGVAFSAETVIKMTRTDFPCLTPRRTRTRLRRHEILAQTMTDSTENATHPKSIESKNSDLSVYIQIGPNFQFEFVPRNTVESGFVDVTDFGGGNFSGNCHKND